jgi:hypothetical protein
VPLRDIESRAAPAGLVETGIDVLAVVEAAKS